MSENEKNKILKRALEEEKTKVEIEAQKVVKRKLRNTKDPKEKRLMKRAAVALSDYTGIVI